MKHHFAWWRAASRRRRHMRDHTATACGVALVRAAALSAAVLVATVAQAEDFSTVAPAVSGDETAQSSPGNRYELAPGDRVLVTVFDQPNLSGDFMIDGNGLVMLPLAGPVVAEGLTVEELQAGVTSLLSDGYLQSPVVNVRIVELRPIYVAGEVNVSGSFPFRYGATVLSAIALAGGLKVTPDAAELLRNDFLAADERLRLLQVNHQALIARRARLLAQRDNLREIDFSELGAEPLTGGLASLMEVERQILSFQRSAHERELELLREQVPRLEAEADALDEQAHQEEAQIAILQIQIADYERLLSNGLARKASILDLQREQAKSRILLAGYASNAARTRLSMNDVEIRLQESQEADRRRTMTELQEVGLKLMELEASLPIAREARDLRARLARSPTDKSKGYTDLRVSRLIGGNLVTLEAEVSTVLWPGDIVQVGTTPDDAGMAAIPSDSSEGLTPPSL